MRAQRCSILREREGLDEYDEIRRDLDLLDERIATLQEWRRDALRSLRELIAKRRAWAV